MASLAPILFVLLWSTGFIVARMVVPHGGPELVIVLRLALTALLLGALAIRAREPLPRGRRLGLHLLAGAMLHGVYLCLSWWAVAHAMPAGVMSLLGALQPLLVAVASFLFLGERLGTRSWLGLAVALMGVVLVLEPVIARGTGSGAPPVAAGAAILAVLAMAAGTMIQRGALAHDPIRVSGAVQNAGGGAVALLALALTRDLRWDGDVRLWLGLGWSVLALSAGGLSLLVWMVRHQGATRVSALLLLVPALAAVEAWALFGERLLPLQLLGFALALGGVLLARAAPRRDRADTVLTGEPG